jgi:hypothetical protein
VPISWRAPSWERRNNRLIVQSSINPMRLRQKQPRLKLGLEEYTKLRIQVLERMVGGVKSVVPWRAWRSIICTPGAVLVMM